MSPIKLEFLLRRHYGKARYYPLNSAAGVIVSLGGRKCLTHPEIKRLKFIGLEIEVRPETAKVEDL